MGGRILKESLLSVGIDIGTSTTQLVFSKLVMENMASDYTIPKIEITDRQIIYRSDIYMTPLKSFNVIDGDGIKVIVEMEYDKAGIKKEDVKTGAVIITGETARKENAQEILSRFSDLAGDFVVATAGPDLESIISGKGAGADVFSKEQRVSVTNIDIGGGTSNLALFKNGKVGATGCFDIGGRILKVDEKLNISYISEKLKELAVRHQWTIKEGETTTIEQLQMVTKRLTEILEMSVGLRPCDKDYDLMVTNHGTNEKPTDYISFSGGVSEYIYEHHNEEFSPKMIFQFGDIGILLGKTIAESSKFKEMKLYKSQERIRATVVGAGSHTTTISGSTVTVNSSVLPAKNLPIIKVEPDEEFIDDYRLNAQSLEKTIEKKLQWYVEQDNSQQTAVAINGIKSPSFKMVQLYGNVLYKVMDKWQLKGQPMIVITGSDMAKVLGQTLTTISCGNRPIVCLDGIALEQGDYIDIGLPAAGGSVVPVVVKTLAFDKK